jgi:hypothetical protein
MWELAMTKMVVKLRVIELTIVTTEKQCKNTTLEYSKFASSRN